MSEAETSKTDKKKVEPERIPNAWLINSDSRVEGYILRMDASKTSMKGVHDGDYVAVVSDDAGSKKVTQFARIHRIRTEPSSVSLYFDAADELSTPSEPSQMGLPVPRIPVERLEWDRFVQALNKVASKTPEQLEAIKDQCYIRRLLQLAVKDDLLGPANGPLEEVVGMSVRDRYIVGRLAPQDTFTGEEDDRDLGAEGEDEGEKESDAARNQTLVPSSFGFTFCLNGDVQELELEVTWGRYERGPSDTVINERTGNPVQAWRRIPSGGKLTLSLKEGEIEKLLIDKDCPEVFLKGVVRPKMHKGDRLVTLFLLNNQQKPDELQDAAWVFQPEIVARGLEGAAIFRRRPVLEDGALDEELSALEMVYRKRVEFAVGHGVSVHAVVSNDDAEKASEVRTVVMPEYEVQVTETPGENPADRPEMRRLVAEGLLDMKKLAELPKDDLVVALKVLVDDYVAWIGDQEARVSSELRRYKESAECALERCRKVSARLEEGIATLSSNPKALEAFRFANRAMALQRTRSIFALKRRRGETVTPEQFDIPKNRSWRPFQLAFVLLSIPALADPLHADRTSVVDALADLLWFPTGGGKTEAYLGVAAFTMAIRRLQGDLGGLDASRGLAVIMRYTLRLLTIQQFQRATALMCAMEIIRMEDIVKWGAEPFMLGLWVGNKVTPGSTAQSQKAIQAIRNGQYQTGSTPAQLTSCPWCGSKINEGRDIFVYVDEERTSICCGDTLQQCEFSHGKRPHGLPVVVVDSEIYSRPPSMLIGTVDKFAMMAWRGETRTLFGKASKECPRHGLLWPGCPCSGSHNAKGGYPRTLPKLINDIRPPDLIIQDEFHLISGPLGTMVGLYETAIDDLSSWKHEKKLVRPKVIASTATVRKADVQVKNVFLRKVGVFPPHGLDIEDNFFSVQRPISEKSGRLYMGVCSPGSSRPAILIRLYVALLTASQALYEKFSSASDPYMTLVGYFNSLRELGGMRRLTEDDVQTRSFRVLMGQVSRPGLKKRKSMLVDELTSRVSSKEIPKKLDNLEVAYKEVWERGEMRSLDVVLATNMLSVGVDVNRLGLMAVNGQPKSTAEYIQATSRVGRSFPGLVCTVLTWSRPRDLSHYETFEHYHATFYKHVEAQSVTPFAPRAMDRGLTGLLLSGMRLNNEELAPNLGAMLLRSTADPRAEKIKVSIENRAWLVTDKREVKDLSSRMLAKRIDRWVEESSRGGRRLGYELERAAGDVVALLKKPGLTRWDEVTAPMSMREVEPGVTLLLDAVPMDEGPAWRSRGNNTNQDSE